MSGTVNVDIWATILWALGLIFTLFTLIIGGVIKWAVVQVTRKLSEQDKTMISIKELLASEVNKLRDMQHNMDVRVVALEQWQRFGGHEAKAGSGD